MGPAPHALPEYAATDDPRAQRRRQEDVVDLVRRITVLERPGECVARELGIGADVLQVRLLEERLERRPARAVVEIADDSDVGLPRREHLLVDLRDPAGLAQALVVVVLLRPVALALQVVEEHDDLLAGRQADRRLEAVPAEDLALRVGVVDVRAERQDLEPVAGHESDVDPAVVVAVDDHHMPVRDAPDELERLRREPLEVDPVLGLDDSLDVGLEVLEDHGRVLHRKVVDRSDLELEPADPVGPSGGHDLEAGRGPREEAPADLPKERERALATAVVLLEVEVGEQRDHARLVGGRVGRLVEERIELVVRVEGGLADAPVGPAERERPGEEVLDVERREPEPVSRHGFPPRCRCPTPTAR